MLSKFVKINGIYDVLYALSTLKMVNIPILQKNHLSMFHSNDPIVERFLAYWIFTYGIIRIKYNCCTPYSYYIETLFVANECLVHKTISFDKGIVIIIISGILGYLTQIDLKHYKYK